MGPRSPAMVASRRAPCARVCRRREGDVVSGRPRIASVLFDLWVEPLLRPRHGQGLGVDRGERLRGRQRSHTQRPRILPIEGCLLELRRFGSTAARDLSFDALTFPLEQRADVGSSCGSEHLAHRRKRNVEGAQERYGDRVASLGPCIITIARGIDASGRRSDAAPSRSDDRPARTVRWVTALPSSRLYELLFWSGRSK